MEEASSSAAAAMDITVNDEHKEGAPIPAVPAAPTAPAATMAAHGGAASPAEEDKQASSLPPLAPPHSSSSSTDDGPSTIRLLTTQPGQPLVLKRLLAVDLPVLCSSPMTAVSMLGGMDRLGAVCTGNARRLQFYFRPEDELSIPIPSQTKLPSSRLLLRVRLRKDPLTGQLTVVAKTEVVGTISTTFQFTALADFQYLTTQAFLPAGAPDVVSKTRLEIVPSSFVPVAHAGNYAYTTLKSSALASQDTARRQGIVIRYGCPIPKGPPAVLVNRPRRRLEKYGQVLEKLQALFDRKRGGREMWQRKALESKFEGDGLHAFLELLRVVAYNMSNGPWRGLWVRYGYDPSQDPVARFYQALDVRWKEAGLEKLKTSYGEVWKKVKEEEGKEEEEEEELKLFGLPVRRQMVFQLCDLGSASLQRLVLGVPRKAGCTSQGGWFRLSDLTMLRGKIKRYLSGKVAECVRTGRLEPVTGGGGGGGEGRREEGVMSPVEIILEAEARREGEEVLPESSTGGGKGGGGGRANGAAAGGGEGEDGEEDDGAMTGTTRTNKRKAAGGGRGGGRGGRGGGGRGRGGKKKARRADEDEEGMYEGESEDGEEGGRGGGRRGGNRGEEEDEEDYYGHEEGMENEEEAGARQLESLLGGQQGRRAVERAGANAAAAARGQPRQQQEEDEDDEDLGGSFVIPLTAGDVQNASSIRLLGGYQGGDYSSSSSDDDGND